MVTAMQEERRQNPQKRVESGIPQMLVRPVSSAAPNPVTARTARCPKRSAIQPPGLMRIVWLCRNAEYTVPMSAGEMLNSFMTVGPAMDMIVRLK